MSRYGALPLYEATREVATTEAVSSQPKPPGVKEVASVASKWSSQPRPL